MIYRNAADRAPYDVGLLKSIDKAHHVVRAAEGLPIEKLFARHNSSDNTNYPPETAVKIAISSPSFTESSPVAYC